MCILAVIVLLTLVTHMQHKLSWFAKVVGLLKWQVDQVHATLLGMFRVMS